MRNQQLPRILPLIAVLVALAPEGALSEGVEVEPMPSRFEPRVVHEDVPRWVSLETVSPEGTAGPEIAWDLLSEGGRFGLQHYFEQVGIARRQGDDSPCPVIQGKPSIDLHRSLIGDKLVEGDGLVRVVRGAKAIYRGAVTGTSPGFYDGNPGTLLRIEVRDELKTEPGEGGKREVFLHHWHAFFELGSQSICVAGSQLGEVPAIGTEVLLFTVREASDPSAALLDSYTTIQIWEDPQRGLIYDDFLRGDPDILVSRDLADLAEIVAEELADRHGEGRP